MKTHVFVLAALDSVGLYEFQKIFPACESLYKKKDSLESTRDDPYFAQTGEKLFSSENLLLEISPYFPLIWIVSSENFENTYNHFRKFLTVSLEQLGKLYFRFYDPRVLKIFLPTCDEKQIIEFFGPIEKFIVEGNSKEEAVVFSQQNGILKTETVSAESVFGKESTNLSENARK